MGEYLRTVNRVPEKRVDGTRNFDPKLFGQPCFDVLPSDKLHELVALGAPYCPIPGENHSSEDESEDGPEDDSEAEAEAEAVFDVEEVVDSRLANGGLEYLVKWQNFPPEDNTWEPFLAKDADDPEYCAKVRAFEFHRRDEDEDGDGDVEKSAKKAKKKK